MPSGGWTGPICLTINRRSLDLIRGGAQVAQLVEHATENRSVGGSIPPLGTICMSPSFLLCPLMCYKCLN